MLNEAPSLVEKKLFHVIEHERIHLFFRDIARAWEAERPRFFYWTPVVLGVGIGVYFVWPREPNLETAFMLTLLSAAAMVLWRGKMALRAVFLVSLGFTLAAASSHMYGTPLLDWPLGPVAVEGTIVDVEQHGEERKGRRLLLEDLSIEKLPERRMPRRIRLVVAERLNKRVGELRPGQRFQALAKLMPLSEPLNPDGFDFRRNGFFQGIGATGYVMGKVQVSDPEVSPKKPSLWFAQFRRDIQAEVKKTLEGDRAGLAIIFLTGDKSSLGSESAEAIRAVGLAHLLAISGLHVSLVAGIVFFLSRALFALVPMLALRFPVKKWAAGLSLISIFFYTLLVGAPVPTRRALMMAGVALLGVMLDRITLSLRTVALAALVILLVWPQMLLHPSFQLSFAAVLGLVSVHEGLRRRGWRLFSGREGWFWQALRYIVELAGMSFVAAVATLPFGLYHFQEAGIYGMLANTLAIPLTGFWLMPVCVFVILLWPFGLAAWPLKLMEPGAGLLMWISRTIASLPGAHYAPPPMPVALMLAATFGGLFFCFTRGRKRWAGLATTILAVSLTFFGTRPAVFLSPNGDQVGWRRDEPKELLITGYDKPEKFIAKYWLRSAGARKDELRFIDNDAVDEPPLSCNETRCVWQGAKGTVAWMRNPDALPGECAKGHAVVVNPFNDRACGAGVASMITYASFRQHGAYVIYDTEKGLRVRYAREIRAARPWSAGWRQNEAWGRFWPGF